MIHCLRSWKIDRNAFTFVNCLFPQQSPWTVKLHPQLTGFHIQLTRSRILTSSRLFFVQTQIILVLFGSVAKVSERNSWCSTENPTNLNNTRLITELYYHFCILVDCLNPKTPLHHQIAAVHRTVCNKGCHIEGVPVTISVAIVQKLALKLQHN